MSHGIEVFYGPNIFVHTNALMHTVGKQINSACIPQTKDKRKNKGKETITEIKLKTPFQPLQCETRVTGKADNVSLSVWCFDTIHERTELNLQKKKAEIILTAW